jgi:hypothetical protein
VALWWLSGPSWCLKTSAGGVHTIIVNVTDPTAGSFGSIVNVNYDTVEEVRVVALGSKAEYGSYSGAAIDVLTRSGKQVRGSILLTKASGHVFGKEVEELKRNQDTLEVRLDARTTSVKETLDLGISVGDFVIFNPRVEIQYRRGVKPEGNPKAWRSWTGPSSQRM